MRNIGKSFHRQRAARQVIQAKIDHIQRGEDFVDTHFQARQHVTAVQAMHFHRQQAIADKRMVGAGIAGVAAGAHHRADVAEVAGDLRIETANPDSALFDVRGAQQNIYQILHVAAHLLRKLAGLDHVVFQQVATNTADQVQAVGFTRAGEDLGHFH